MSLRRRNVIEVLEAAREAAALQEPRPRSVKKRVPTGRALGLPSRKRAKISEPVRQKLAVVHAWLGDAQCQVAGPPTCRRMLLDQLGFAVGEGAASNERHRYQEVVVKMLAQVLERAEKTAQQLSSERQAAATSGEALKTSLDTTLADAENSVKAKQAELEDLRKARDDSIDALAAAQTALAKSKSDLDNFADHVEQLVRDKDHNKMVLENVEYLKLGEPATSKTKKKMAEKKLAQLVTFLEKQGVDPSMLKAGPTALNLAPEKRGLFDQAVIVKLLQVVQRPLDALEEKLSKGSDDLKAQTERAHAEAKQNLEAAEAKKEADENAAEAAAQALLVLEAAVETAEDNIADQERELKRIVKDNEKAEAVLSQAKEASAAFAELRSREETPEAEGASEPEGSEDSGKWVEDGTA